MLHIYLDSALLTDTAPLGTKVPFLAPRNERKAPSNLSLDMLPVSLILSILNILMLSQSGGHLVETRYNRITLRL